MSFHSEYKIHPVKKNKETYKYIPIKYYTYYVILLCFFTYVKHVIKTLYEYAFY